VDFRRFGLINAYEDDNAFVMPHREWILPERYFIRIHDGQPEFTVRQESQMEAVAGSHGRSALDLGGYNSVWGPVGDDGYAYPKPLWDFMTGKIDHQVARCMRDHDYDLRYYLQNNWQKIRPSLVGKIHLICGDMDDYYSNLAVYLLENLLKTRNYGGSFAYGRPLAPHEWQPMTNAQLLRTMAEHIARNAPPGETLAWKTNQ
jgi:hypothetical protein